jgi:hypothetical protein
MPKTPDHVVLPLDPFSIIDGSSLHGEVKKLLAAAVLSTPLDTRSYSVL